MPSPFKANAITTRSRVVLEIAAELVAMEGQSLRQAKVLLRAQGEGDPDWPLRLFGSSTNEGIEAVVTGESALAIINPAAALRIAYLGSPPYQAPQPVRTLAVIPSFDQYVFAVHPTTRLSRFEEIGEKRYPLKVLLRDQSDHCLHFILDHVVAAAGFTLQDLASWGGDVRRDGSLPYPDSAKFHKLVAGAIDGIFDEGVYEWVQEATEAGMTLLPLAESTLHKLEALGYRRSKIEKRQYPRLPRDIPTIDFSGWAIFVHAELPDAMVTRFCTALEARKHLIPWEGEGPLPVERMCRDAPDTPMDVPLHPAAERYWRQRGYI
jgi:hypothetical protein